MSRLVEITQRIDNGQNTDTFVIQTIDLEHYRKVIEAKHERGILK